ncbi:MAG TPA: hypothetical protein PLJ05_06635 [Caldisericia bacterium]|nr:hypothetical protein [Caldisericia bacterium]
MKKKPASIQRAAALHICDSVRTAALPKWWTTTHWGCKICMASSGGVSEKLWISRRKGNRGCAFVNRAHSLRKKR